ncbi:ER-derived vesicles protein ERV14 [Pluteus cervinus]|uniref:ER-derived vesicles protein ERV14 n=1 Tax=Pluteus cervinus TaxID=181527 RepID=A0ACD3B861_9AGAR|nr:ER-derived vesicles protein ERV14 [Pluteus cervinus]
MGPLAWLYLFSILVSAGFLFCTVYFIIMFSDLESDYVNPIDLCSRLNPLVVPEHGAHAVMTTLFVLSGQWVAILLNAPLVAFNVNKILKKGHVYDPTEIFRTVERHKMEVYIKLAFYLVMFFWYLYSFIAVLVAEGG